MSQPKRMTAKDRAGFLRVRGSTRHSSIPGYDLCVLLFGVLAVAQILRALMDEEALSRWQIAGLIVSIFLALFFSYKAHTANDESDINQS
ncbi:hypothetical protein ACYSUW_13220 [Pseudomonas frederiksbergensis]